MDAVYQGDARSKEALGASAVAEGVVTVTKPDGVWDCDSREVGTTMKGALADGSDAARNCHAREAGATIKGGGTDGGNAIRNGDGRDVGATLKGGAADGGDMRRYDELAVRAAWQASHETAWFVHPSDAETVAVAGWKGVGSDRGDRGGYSDGFEALAL